MSNKNNEPGQESAAHGSSDHGVGEHHQSFNWVNGFLGEKEGVEPNLLWREPGAPVPFGALLLNTALLVFLFVKFGSRKVAEGLKSRRSGLLAGIETAAKMQSEAEAALAHHRGQLDNLASDIERVRSEMKKEAEEERKRVLSDAVQRRERLEAEARLLIEQELEAAKEVLLRRSATSALAAARNLLVAEVSSDDDRRLCEEYVNTLARATDRGSSSAVGGLQ